MSLLKELQTLDGHDDRVWHVSWSPRGDAIASCSGDRTVRIWAPNPDDSWRCVAILEGTHTRTVRSCSWSPNSRCLATASFDRTVAIWEVQGDSWEHVATLEGHENEVKAAAWNPNGNLIATCGRDKTIWIWEAAPGHEYDVIDVKHGHSQDVKAVKWHPSGELLVSVSYDDSIKLWMENDDEWICIQTIDGGSDSITGHASTVWDVAFSPSGEHFATVSDDCTMKIWSIEIVGTSNAKCKLVSNVTGYHTRTIFSVDWSVDGHIATAGADDSVCIFSLTENHETGGISCVLECRMEQAHVTDVNCVRWSPKDGCLLATAADDGSIKLWRLQNHFS